MRFLTWIPADIRGHLAALDPARTDETTATIPANTILVSAKARRGEEDIRFHHRERSRVRPIITIGGAVVSVALLAVLISTMGVHTSSQGHRGAANVNLTGPTARWADFPISQVPRPIVLTGSDVADPAGGFSDSQSKLAYISGSIVSPTTLPTNPGQADGYALQSPVDAVEELLKVPTSSVTAVMPLHISSVVLDSHEFETDRGVQNLPAWRVQFSEISDPAYVLAVAASDRYPATLSSPATQGAARPVTASSDGRTLTISFVDSQPAVNGACAQSGYTNSLSVTQTATAVVLDVQQHDDPVQPASTSNSLEVCSAVGHVVPTGRPHRIALDAPLGSRVVLTADGTPYTVTTQ